MAGTSSLLHILFVYAAKHLAHFSQYYPGALIRRLVFFTSLSQPLLGGVVDGLGFPSAFIVCYAAIGLDFLLSVVLRVSTSFPIISTFVSLVAATAIATTTTRIRRERTLLLGGLSHLPTLFSTCLAKPQRGHLDDASDPMWPFVSLGVVVLLVALAFGWRVHAAAAPLRRTQAILALNHNRSLSSLLVAQLFLALAQCATPPVRPSDLNWRPYDTVLPAVIVLPLCLWTCTERGIIRGAILLLAALLVADAATSPTLVALVDIVRRGTVAIAHTILTSQIAHQVDVPNRGVIVGLSFLAKDATWPAVHVNHVLEPTFGAAAMRLSAGALLVFSFHHIYHIDDGVDDDLVVLQSDTVVPTSRRSHHVMTP
ncbi:Aste57867_19167 [Aphanomyces stellatus]|uniref:Aste57867_19167 protein n=1 Tax=Aphanomyces stellatus TaxID=120398 RepID=A0A485LCS1_9STRA|nr:hypothetical protein As57867_019103 [Aphanomyces stellatus]VFT95889.1 Aste57867_19167 [Aphanomyces stellatus]